MIVFLITVNNLRLQLIKRNRQMNYLCFLSTCAVTLVLILPAYSMQDDDVFIRLNVIKKKFSIGGTNIFSRYNIFYGAEDDRDGISNVYNFDDPSNTVYYMPNNLPCMPYFSPYEPNNRSRKDSAGIISFPLIIRLPGAFSSNLPQSLQDHLFNDDIATEKLCVGIVAQDVPFEENTQLCFRPHTYLWPKAPREALGKKEDKKDVYTGIFESVGGAKFVARKNNTIGSENVRVHQERGGKNTVFSPDNMHIEGVSNDHPGSFYTYTRYNNKKSAVICLHLLMNDAQTEHLASILDEAPPDEVKDRGKFLKFLENKEKELISPFENYEGLQRICTLLQKPKAALVKAPIMPAPPSATPVAAPSQMTPTPSIGVQSSPIINTNDITLAEFKVYDVSWNHKGNKIFSNGKHSVEVKWRFVDLQNKIVDVEFRLNDMDSPITHSNVRLRSQQASFALDKEKTYDYKSNVNLEEYIKSLFPIANIQSFLSKNLNVEGLGSVQLYFSRIRNIVNYKLSEDKSWELEDDNDACKSIIKIPYGFEGEGESNAQEILPLDHHEKKLMEHRDIWYLDSQRWLRRVKTVKYRTIRPELIVWAKDNEIPVTSYSKLENDSGEMFLLNLPSGLPQDRYFRLQAEDNVRVTHYVYYDNGRGLFKAQIRFWQIHLQELEEKGLNFTFKDKSKKFNYVYTVKQSQNPIILPSKTGSGGQIARNRNFKEGFYRLLRQQEDDKNIIQTWVEEPQTGESVVISFSSIKDSGKWAALASCPNIIRPVSIEGKTVFDVSQHLHDMSEEAFAELKNYLHTLFWLERKRPRVKYYPSNINPKQQNHAKNYVNNLIKEMHFLTFDLDSGSLLTQEKDQKWALMDLSIKPPSNRTCLWSPNPPSLIDTIKNQPDLKEVDLTKTKVPNYPRFFAFLADEPKIEGVGVKMFIKKVFKDMGLTDSQIIKLVRKCRNLEQLELSNLINFKDLSLIHTLISNASTLTHLNLSGTRLRAQGDDFISAVQGMKHLKFLNILKADLSNDQTVALTDALSDKQQLTNVKLTMPYLLSKEIGLLKNVYGRTWNAAKDVKGELELAIFILGFPIAMGCEILLEDILGFPYRDNLFVCVSHSLVQIPALETLTLEIWGVFDRTDFIKTEFNHLREKVYELKPIKVEFTK